MKKVLSVWSLVMLMTMYVGFSSCSKDDEESGNGGDIGKMIVGKWQLVESSDTDNEPCDFQGWDEFKSDGKMSSYDACTSETTTGRWTADSGKNTITTTYDVLPISITFDVVSLTDKELILEGNVFGQKIKYKFKKI
jgi:hypothetical protein